MTQIELGIGTPKKTCQFCLIVAGEQRCYKVHESNISFVFLDTRPLFPGHCLVVPKEHFETLSDLPRTYIGAVFATVRLITRSVEKAMNADGSFVAINNHVSQSVPHFHVHIVPRNRKDGLRGFFWPRHPYRDEASVTETQRKIVECVNEIVAKEGL